MNGQAESVLRRTLIDRETLRRLSTLRPWRTSLTLAAQWVIIAATIWLSEIYWHPLVYLAACVILGSRYHAIGVLVHEYAHKRGFRSRRLNEVFGEIAALPLTLSMNSFRRSHLAHHNHPNTDDDPDWVQKKDWDAYRTPKSKAGMVMWLLRTAVGFYMVEFSLRRNAKLAGDTRQENVPDWVGRVRTAFFVGVAATLTLGGWWFEFLLYWFVPIATTGGVFFFIRSIAEHFGSVDYGDPLRETRTVVPNLFERLTICPYGINWHIEHHLFPSVPFYNLPELHETLMRNPTYRSRALVTHGYWNVLFGDCIADGPDTRASQAVRPKLAA